LISESFEGLITAETRQNSGRSFAATKVIPPWGPATGRGVGKVSAPAATVCAVVIVVSGTESEERLSQVAAVEAGEPSSATNIGAKITTTSFMSRFFRSFEGNTKTREDYYKRGTKADS
jgi:hypothetical protein